MSPRVPVATASTEDDPLDTLDAGGVPAVFADRARMAAIWTGFGAAALGFFVAVVVALAMWVPDAAATGTSGSTVRGGLLAFLAAQHGGVRIDGVGIGFIPLGLTWFAVHLCRRSGRVLWALPAVVGACSADDVGQRRVLELTAVQVGSYAVTTTLVSFYAVVGRSSASPVAVALGSVAVGLVGFGSVALTMTPLGAQRWLRLPAPVRSAAKAGAAATCTFLAGGALLALGSTLIRIGRFLDLTRGMGRGLSGLPVAVGDTLAVPNAVLAGTSYLAGPGFAVGHHATYAPFGGHGGLVPAFPVLAGLPDGEHASLTVLALLAITVLGAGLAAGMIVARETALLRWPVALGTAAGSGAGAAVLLGVLTALAGGSLGSRRLETVGASPVQVGLAVLVEVALVSTATVGGRRLLAHRAARDRTVARADQTDHVKTGSIAEIRRGTAAPTDAELAESTHAALQALAGAMRRSALARARAARPGWASVAKDAAASRPSETAVRPSDPAVGRPSGSAPAANVEVDRAAS